MTVGLLCACPWALKTCLVWESRRTGLWEHRAKDVGELAC